MSFCQFKPLILLKLMSNLYFINFFNSHRVESWQFAFSYNSSFAIGFKLSLQRLHLFLWLSPDFSLSPENDISLEPNSLCSRTARKASTLMSGSVSRQRGRQYTWLAGGSWCSAICILNRRSLSFSAVPNKAWPARTSRCCLRPTFGSRTPISQSRAGHCRGRRFLRARGGGTSPFCPFAAGRPRSAVRAMASFSTSS